MEKNVRKSASASSLGDLAVRPSGIHGLGVFSRSPLRNGDLVGNYSGHRSGTAVERRADELTYLFALSDGSFIDGSLGGNSTRHINHSCDPNCRAEEYHLAGGRLGVRIKAMRAIPEGQELFLDYSLEVDPGEDPSTYACQCGTPACRGSLVAAGESESTG